MQRHLQVIRRNNSASSRVSLPWMIFATRRCDMDCKRACLIINPRAGQNFAKLNDLLAVFWAAGWKTDIAIKVYGGHAMKLATRAAEKGYDLVIAFGGDGTLSQVMNGVMNAREQ